jgi:flagellar M-ring protein FliF
MFQFTKDDIMYFIQLGVMMLLSLVVLFMVIRPLLKRILAADPKPVEEPVPALPEAPPAPPQITSNAAGHMIDVAQVQGQVHAQAVHRVGELAERNPTETASIIRQWLAEPA